MIKWRSIHAMIFPTPFVSVHVKMIDGIIFIAQIHFADVTWLPAGYIHPWIVPARQ